MQVQFHVKTDGTLWVCGTDSYGRLGRGGAGDICSPVQIGSATDWDQPVGNVLGGSWMIVPRAVTG